MLCGVFFLACEYVQIFRSIIAFISIDVMDDFTLLEWSAEHLFSNYSVLMFSIELPVGFTFASAHSRITMRLSISIFSFPSSWVSFGI